MLQFVLFASLISSLGPFENKPEDFNYLIWNRQNALEKNGLVDSGDWFEWWYTKAIDPQTKEAFFLVYGVVNPWDQKESRAASRSYVSMGSFADHEFIEEKHSVSEFSSSYDRTYAKIGSQFQMTDTSFQGAFANGKATWNLTMKKNWTFNAMGWGMFYSWISNIFWYPAQASATMSGEMEFKGRKIKIENLPAYQDRNWGRGFPDWWAWIVSNHFENSPGTALAIGGGRPKTFQKIFLASGLCIALNHNGHEYVFRTTDADKIKFEIRFGRWEIQAENEHKERLEVSAYAPKEEFLLLPFVSPKGETFYDYETLTGDVQIKLFKKKSLLSTNWDQVANLKSEEAGIEFGSRNPQALNLNSLMILQ